MKILILSVMTGALVTPAVACDLCAVYSATQAQGGIGKGFLGGVAEQFTHFGTLQDTGQEVANPTGQHLDSSISQVFAGYNFSERIGVQFNLPIIYRSFVRPDGFAIDRGTESGIGDASLIGSWVVYSKLHNDLNITWTVLGGIKFPTGSSARIAEELNEVEVPGAPESGIHGHDLALGSGSVDGIVGTSVWVRWRRLTFAGNLQYAIRSTGDFDYRFANDLIWSAAPGVYLALKEEYTLTLQAAFSGEVKGLDTIQGAKADDTGITALYIGPQVRFTWGSRLSAQVGVDLPVILDNTALQAVPDYRVRAGFVWRF